MKSVLLRTPLGPLAQSLRERLNLVKASLFAPEQTGAIANDMLARYLLERLCIEGGRFVDVGAHIGSVISGVLRHSRPAEILAFEAIPEKADRLRKAFPSVSIFECAVGDQEGDVRFFIADEESGYSSLDPDLAKRQGKVREIKVALHQLDRLIKPEGIDVIKIDVEGAELGVMRGAAEITAKARPTIMFESGLTEMEGFSRIDLWHWLESQGYELLLPSRLAHDGVGLGAQGYIESHFYPPRATNYFAVARDRRDEVRARARTILGIK